MKKFLIASAFAFLGLTCLNAQETGFKVGVHVGLPSADASDSYSFKLGADAAYLWAVSDDFSAGIGTGFQSWFGKKVTLPIIGEIKNKNVSMVPLVATGEYKLADKFLLGADLGYGFLFSNGNNDGGFYYQPKATYQVSDKTSVWLGYQGLTKNSVTWGAINLGVAISVAK